MHEGVGGLLRDKSRPPGKAPIAPDRVAWIVRLTQQPPPHEATHWTLRAMAAAWRSRRLGHGAGDRKAHGVLKPAPLAALQAVEAIRHSPRRAHCISSACMSRSAGSRGGARSIDEKSQIQALDRTCSPACP